MGHGRGQISFVVEGFGDFPLDMLRYDECWPYDPHDVSALLHTDWRTVRLETDNRMKPTIARWESFGWRVVEVTQ